MSPGAAHRSWAFLVRRGYRRGASVLWCRACGACHGPFPCPCAVVL